MLMVLQVETSSVPDDGQSAAFLSYCAVLTPVRSLWQWLGLFFFFLGQLLFNYLS